MVVVIPETLLPRSLPAELAFLQELDLLPLAWEEAQTQAQARQSTLFDALIADGALDEEMILRALAQRLNLPFTLEPPSPSLADAHAESFHFRSYPVIGTKGARLRVMAPNGALVRMLLSKKSGPRALPFILTTRQALLKQLVHVGRDKMLQQANFRLPERLSARAPAERPVLTRPEQIKQGSLRFIWLVALIIWAVLDVTSFLMVPPFILAPAFLFASIAALSATIEALDPPPRLKEAEPHPLPRYAILVPLYQEAEIVPHLIARLNALDYPRDRLEAFLLVEDDDARTRAALAASALPSWMLVLVVPEGAPRTKPRALNVALPFVSADFLVIYDAEDEPEPDQLRKAEALFARLTVHTACLQARLGISNPRDGFLTRRFATDYAVLFDLFKAGAARFGWAVPLGGSSNHFRVSSLRGLGGWDSWNVTEDADLGIRLARFGYRVADLDSTTWEEAPNTLRSWLNQRTRWIKGWLQTFAVHARTPMKTIRELGVFRAAVIGSTAISVILGALLYPVFVGALTLRISSDVPLGEGSPFINLVDAMIIVLIFVGLLLETIPPFLALKRRRALWLLPTILLAPMTYLLVSVAAWRSLWEWQKNPFHWHKTAHGLAKRHEPELVGFKSKEQSPN